MLLSIIIVTKDEEAHVETCLDSIFSQLSEFDYSDCEVIVVDSLSADKTVTLATKKLKKFNSISYKILFNKGVSLAKGWNIGIRASSGKYVLRPDAHAELKKNYINTGLNILKQDDSIDAVGGVLETKIKKKGLIAKGIKFFLTSSVGMGNSNFRVSKESGYFDTVLYAIYKRSLFTKLGFFDESLHRHEDTEMHGRLIRSGKKLFTSNKMIAVYYARDSLTKLSRQMFMNGYYSYEVPVDGGLKIRHHIPGFFYGLLFLVLIFSIFNVFFLAIFLFLFASYFLVISYFSLKEHKGNIKNTLIGSLIVILGHSSYAYGYFRGIIKRFINVLSVG